MCRLRLSAFCLFGLRGNAGVLVILVPYFRDASVAREGEFYVFLCLFAAIGHVTRCDIFFYQHRFCRPNEDAYSEREGVSNEDGVDGDYRVHAGGQASGGTRVVVANGCPILGGETALATTVAARANGYAVRVRVDVAYFERLV